MALAKAREFNRSGVTLNYWRITKLEVDLLVNSTKAILSGYASMEARDAGKAPIESVSFIWNGADNPVTQAIMLQGTAYAACYNKIKQQAAGLGNTNSTAFADAEDI